MTSAPPLAERTSFDLARMLDIARLKLANGPTPDMRAEALDKINTIRAEVARRAGCVSV